MRVLHPREKDERIFPMTYGPVLVGERGRVLVKRMRYTGRLRGTPESNDVAYTGTYNAHRDKLTGYWRDLHCRATR